VEDDVDFAEDVGRARGELVAPAEPDDGGRAAAFSLAVEEDETGALDNLGGWYACGGRGSGLTLSTSFRAAISSTGFIASASDWSKAALSVELGDISPPDASAPAASRRFLLASSSSARRITSISPWTKTPSSQLWCTRSEAFARLSGWRRSMGVRKEEIASASSFGKRYLSCRTQSSGQYRSLFICRSSPC
jgi:hypothetical protein